MDFIEGSIVFVICVLLFGLFFGMYKSATSPTFTLQKNQWECVKEEQYTTFMYVNKMMIPQIHTRCVEYKAI
jgi:hypothetical protein